MRFARSAALLALALPLAACSDRSDPTAVATAVDLPALAVDMASQGAVIERYQGGLSIWWYDPDTQLLAAHIWRDPYGACVPPGTPYDAYMTSFKDVITSRDPEDVALIREIGRAKEISIKVWHSEIPLFSIALRCSEPIASGIGQLVLTDNDALAYLADRNRANAFGYMAQGRLTGPEGERYHYNGVFRTKWQPNSADPDDRYHEVLKVNLRPIGK